LDGEILEVTEVEDMEQEIMDTDEYNLHLDITIHQYKDPKVKNVAVDNRHMILCSNFRCFSYFGFP
jgi:hypothetical protein